MFANFPQCVYCRTKDNLTIDHIIPISKGGENTLNNVVPACVGCNSKKRARLDFATGCKQCLMVLTDRILSNAEWANIHSCHTKKV